MLLINTPIWCPKISSEMMLQDFDVTKKYSMLQPKRCYKKNNYVTKKIKHVTRKNTVENFLYKTTSH